MERQRNKSREKKKHAEARSGIKIILSALVIAFLITRFLISSTVVEGNSMLESLHQGDRLFVLKQGIAIKDLKRGDIIVFHAPDENRDYIKRIIAFPHEYVQIDKGLVYINGKRLEEPYISSDFTHCKEESEWLLGEGELFVMGDNRQEGASKDSRNFGPVKQDAIVGKAVFRYYPFDDFGGI